MDYTDSLIFQNGPFWTVLAPFSRARGAMRGATATEVLIHLQGQSVGNHLRQRYAKDKQRPLVDGLVPQKI
jgi:hypothetical protein